MTKIRESQGGAFESRGAFFMRVTIAPQTRPAKLLPWCASLTDARTRANETQALVNRLRTAGATDFIENLVKSAATADAEKMASLARAVDGIAGGQIEKVKPKDADRASTFEGFAEEWTSGRLSARHPDHVRTKDSSDDESRLAKYINPTLGPLRLSAVTLADAERVMSALPTDLEPSTRRHIAQVIGRVMKLAVYPGRHIKVSPIPIGWLPQKSKPKARGYLYPDEDAALMACTTIPIWRRMLWGFIAREGTRGPSEALSFRWRHVDIERGAVRLDENKTDDPRAWALNPGVTRALKAWRKLTVTGSEADDPIFAPKDEHDLDITRLAGALRDDLKEAIGNALRPELLEQSAHRIRIRAHDLRASFITIALANGRSETWVTDRTGHTTSAQLMNYRRAARTITELQLGDFKPLDEAIPELRSAAAGGAANAAAGGESEWHESDVSTGKCTGRDSNPHALRRRNLKTEETQANENVREERDIFDDRREPSPPPLPRPAAASTDPVESALAAALTGATEAGRWDVVAQLAGELQARRSARAGNVVALKSRQRGGA